ncbi:MAG TPA: hypothetical protein VLJ19_13955 [Variovorax sp.]|nr:hypothetical protein [Variovorax sp.]
MKNSIRARAAALALGLCGLLQSPAIQAQEESPLIPKEAGWELTLAPYAYHYHSDPLHEPVYLIGIERHRADNWLAGAAYFSNSFGQPSGVVYVGYVWNSLFGVPALYARLVAGIMYGYRAPYEDKVPYNHDGWSPVIVPSLGWRLTPNDALQISTLGSAGLLFSYNRRF